MEEATKRKQMLYMRVTKDKYEFPVAIAKTKMELARLLGVPHRSVYSAFFYKCKGYVEVEVELEEGEIL